MIYHIFELRLIIFIFQAVVGEEIWIDPTESEVELADSTIIIACMPALGTITNVRQNGLTKPADTLKVS